MVLIMNAGTVYTVVTMISHMMKSNGLITKTVAHSVNKIKHTIVLNSALGNDIIKTQV